VCAKYGLILGRFVTTAEAAAFCCSDSRIGAVTLISSSYTRAFFVVVMDVVSLSFSVVDSSDRFLVGGGAVVVVLLLVGATTADDDDDVDDGGTVVPTPAPVVPAVLAFNAAKRA